MTTASDVIDLLDTLSDDRMEVENAWIDILQLAFPLGGELPSGNGASGRRATINRLVQPVNSARRSPDIYDTTLFRAINLTSAGIESFMTPAGVRWGKLSIADQFGKPTTNTEDQWLDATNGFIFSARYDTPAGFATANTRALRSCTALGTGVFRTDSTEALGSPLSDPFRYTFIPTVECYIIVDARGTPIGLLRWYSLTADQIAKAFNQPKDTIPVTISNAANDPQRSQDTYDIVHAVMLRDEKGSRGNTTRDSLYASYYVAIDDKVMIRDSGYFTFPYTVYTWVQNANNAYGETPVMVLMSNAKSLNLASRNNDIAVQQNIAPPIATNNAVDIDMNPLAVNPGLLTDRGEALFRPIIANPRPDISQSHIEIKKADIEAAMGLNLWSVGIEGDPRETATRTLARRQERALFLGPTGSIIQGQQAQMVEREIDILGRRGAFTPEGPLSPPASLLERGADVRATFTAPFNTALRAEEGLAIENTFAFTAAQAQLDPNAPAIWHSERASRRYRQAQGAPADIFKSEDELKQDTQQREQIQQAQMAAQMTEQGAGAVTAAADAQTAANDSGLSDGPVGDMIRNATTGAA